MRKRFTMVFAIFVMISLIAVPIYASPLQIGGSTFTEIRYTPENLMQGAAGVMLWANIESDLGEINIDLMWASDWGVAHDDKYDNNHDFPFMGDNKPELGMVVNSVVVRADGRLLNSMATNAEVLMGNLDIDYSNWTASLSPNHWEGGSDIDAGNTNTRGISLEGLRISPDFLDSPIVLSAFYGFHSNDQVMYGTNLTTWVDTYRTNLSALRFVAQTEAEEDAYWYGEPSAFEHAVELSVDGNINRDLSMDLTALYWQQNRNNELASPFSRLMLDWNSPIGDVDFEVYSSFGQEFSPTFYNRRDDDIEGEIEGYLDRMGTGGRVSIAVDNSIIDFVDLSLGTDVHDLVANDLLYNRSWIRLDRSFGQVDAAVKVENKLPFNTELKRDPSDDYYETDVFAGLSALVLSEDLLDLNANVLSVYNRVGERLVVDGNLEAKFTSGLFNNLSLFAGAQTDVLLEENTIEAYAGLNYNTPSGLEIMGRFATDAVQSLGFDGFDDVDEKEEIIFSIKRSIDF
ncbi:hypothetical protein [Natronospora cellulosivora (SeqCode)]